MNDLRIRAGTLDDIDIMVRHRLGMFRDMGVAEEKLTPMTEPARAYFRKAVPAGGYRAFFVETEDGRVIAGGGVLIIHWPGSQWDARDSKAMILNMYVEREFRRRGIARRLMQEMIAWCRENGYKSVSVHASNEGRPLYESLGFQPTNEMRLTL